MKNENRVKAGRKSKRKGNNNERKLAEQFQTWWGEEGVTFQRTPSSGGWATKKAREEFKTSGDVITSAVNFPFCIEAKKQEGWSLESLMTDNCEKVWKWWQQTVDETPNNLTPLLVFARNRVKPMVMMRFADLDVQVQGMLARGSSILTLADFDHGYPVVVFPLSSLFSLDSALFKVKLEDLQK